MIEPLSLSFDVRAPSTHAFDVWTRDIGRWWPADHTATGEDGLTVTLEPRVGGRIFERTTDGRESDWGEILVWEPPRRFVYTWHLRRSVEESTEVEIRFVATAPDATRVEIEHRGWERLGSEGPSWRDRNRGGWETLLPHYVAAVAAA
ncbi:MAG TPA: SRPBCC family protein [Candidatus Limnocylindrales bacterium]